MLRALGLPLLFAGCITSSSNQVNVPATLASIGGFAVLGGIAVAAVPCDASDSEEQCAKYEENAPTIAAATIITGAALLILAAALYSEEKSD